MQDLFPVPFSDLLCSLECSRNRTSIRGLPYCPCLFSELSADKKANTLYTLSRDALTRIGNEMLGLIIESQHFYAKGAWQ